MKFARKITVIRLTSTVDGFSKESTKQQDEIYELTGKIRNLEFEQKRTSNKHQDMGRCIEVGCRRFCFENYQQA